MNIQITSIGKACSEINAMPDQIRRAAAELDVKPAATIDGRIYFNVDDIRAIGSLLHDHPGEPPKIHC